jgi:hypothetical protein
MEMTMMTDERTDEDFTLLHYTELWDYAIRGLERLEVDKQYYLVHTGAGYMYEAPLLAVQEISLSQIFELEGRDSSDWVGPTAYTPQLRLAFGIEYPYSQKQRITWRFPSDAGVIPYGDGQYNRVNFLLDKTELRDAGILVATTKWRM